jgi:hypothetical protein
VTAIRSASFCAMITTEMARIKLQGRPGAGL